MEYLSSIGFVHMDLAARNCLLHKNNSVKICDFGLTARLKLGQDKHILDKERQLPIAWMAIESLEKKYFTVKTDVWSFGVVLWEFFSGNEAPYKSIAIHEIENRVKPVPTA